MGSATKDSDTGFSILNGKDANIWQIITKALYTETAVKGMCSCGSGSARMQIQI
jgi:hypothetical protein